MCWRVSFLLYLNNSAESCRLRQLSEFHLQSLPGVDTLTKILEQCCLAGHTLLILLFDISTSVLTAVNNFYSFTELLQVRQRKMMN